MKNIFVVYRITNKINGKMYIGKSSLKKIKNGYFGSSDYLKNSVKKYGKENFSLKIEKRFELEDDAYEYERILIEKENAIESKRYYNLAPGGRGNPKGIHATYFMKKKYKNNYHKIASEISKKAWTKERKEEFSKKQKERNSFYSYSDIPSPSYGKKIHDEKFIEQFKKNVNSLEAKEKREKTYKENLEKYGSKIPPEGCKKLSESQKTEKNAKSVPLIIIYPNGEEIRYPSMRQAGEKSGFGDKLLRSVLRKEDELPKGYSVRYATEKITTGGVHFNNNSGKKISKSNIGKKKTITKKTIEGRKKLGRSRVGKFWINKNGKNKLVEKEEKERLLKDGWKSGLYRHKDN